MAPVGFLKRTFQEFSADKAGQMSAAFAYIAVFSIAPLLLVVVSVIGFVFGERAAQGQLYSHLASAFGPDTAKTLQSVIANSHHAGRGVVALVSGVIGMLLGAAGLTSQLQNSFDTILGAVPDPKGGLKRTIFVKIKNLVVIGLASLAVIASVVLTAVIRRANWGAGAEVLNSLASLAVFIAILYLIYRFLPDVVVPRRIAWLTAAAIGFLFAVGKIILGLIISRNGTASAYGAAASLVVLLLWFYYMAQILLLGAEGLKVYGEAHAVSYRPKRYTMKRQSLNVNVKQDFRGRLLEGFSRGYKSKSKHR